MLLSQLIVAPVVVFEAWLYLLVLRRYDPAGRTRAVDWVVVFAGVALCLAVLPAIAGYESGGNDRIWRPVLSTLSTFFIFPSVLLLAAWWRLRSLRSARN